jgi:hypothetical protein
MITVRMFLTGGVGAALLALSGLTHAQSAAALAATQQQLQSVYTLTKATADDTDVVTAGAVVVLEKDNLLMCRVNLPIPTPNVYKNGAIDQEGLLGVLGRMGTAPPPGGGAPNTRKFVAGEKFFVTNIEVQKDGVVYRVLSDPFQDMRYHATLKFPFAKGAAPSSDDIISNIAAVLKIDSGDSSGMSAGSAPAPSPAPAVQTKTIALGQTRDQVISMFGQPAKVVQLGTKEIDYYPDMKVTFVQSKVTNVE